MNHPVSGISISTPEPLKSFVRQLELARDAFEGAQRLTEGTRAIAIVDRSNSVPRYAFKGPVLSNDEKLLVISVNALLMLMLAHIARAYRIVHQRPTDCASYGVDAEEFKRRFGAAKVARDNYEHRLDDDALSRKRRANHGTKIKRTLLGKSFEFDTTSMIIVSPTEMYIGGIDVVPVYRELCAFMTEIGWVPAEELPSLVAKSLASQNK